MTTRNENGNINENDQTTTVIQESSNNEIENKLEEINEQKNDSDSNEEHEKQKEKTVNNNNHHNNEDVNRSKRSFHSKVKYPSVPYYRSAYYSNGHPYGPPPYYYFHHSVASLNEKPTPLMVIPTQQSTTTTTTTTTATATTDNSTTTTTTTQQNLPPRLRETTTNENDSNSQQTSTPQPTTTNGRRHRSILPRGTCNYYAPHPPPLMATPPGVLFPYPSTVHQPGSIAYNIRASEELEFLGFQQPMINFSSPYIWPPATTYPHFSPYQIYGPSSYMYNNPLIINSNNSLLNPEAAEWIPPSTDTDTSSSDNNILIDDEIHFPPLNTNNNNLNTNRSEENQCEQKIPIDSSSENDSTNNFDNTTTKVESTDLNSSSSQDNTKRVSSSSTLTYSTVILQPSDVNKSNKNVHMNNQQQRRQQQQQPTIGKDRPTKQQRTQNRMSDDNLSRRRQITSNRNNINETRHSIAMEQTKPQINDEWIEVKSKKTKKFDRSTNDIQYDTSEKIQSEEQVQIQILTPPSSNHNTIVTCASEDDDDLSQNKIPLTKQNKIVTSTDYNQTIIDDIHSRLDNDERLLIIIRGCPGSGRTTLARSINDGYHGEILSGNEDLIDSSRIECEYFHYRQLVLDSLKRNVSPIIINNTNATSLEMRPFVILGKEEGYNILLVEPQTPWRYKPRELVKRNHHNLQLRRIKEILNRFEHNLTVEDILDQIKTNILSSNQTQQIVQQDKIDNESNDPILISKKSFDIIDDSDILNDVRLCIKDMISFLTSNSYQTSLSTSFSDLSLIPSSSSPSTPSTPHALFHRSLSRFSSTTTSQDHSFNNEHYFRSSNPFSRCCESLSSPSSINSNIIGKKRRKHKNKQQSNELSLNTNNNNNNNNQINENDYYLQNFNYNVYLSEDFSNAIVIDEQNISDCLHNVTQNFYRNNSSSTPHKKVSTKNKNDGLINIIHDEFVKPSLVNEQHPSISKTHISIQCSPDDLNQEINNSCRTLIGHSFISKNQSINLTPISPPPGYIECGIQVDLNENNIDSLTNLIEYYSERVSSDIIKQFYEVCNADIQWTRTQLDEYLQHSCAESTFPTLRQLSFNALNQWDEQIKHSNPSFDTISISVLLQDINDEEVFEDILLENNSIETPNSNEIFLPWTIINSLQESYGQLPIKSSLSDNPNGLSLQLDDNLSMSIYQSLQKSFGITNNKIIKPVNEKKSNKENKKFHKQQWNLPTQNEKHVQSNKITNGPSFQQIMEEELNYIQAQQSVQKRPTDFASQHKFKALERDFPSLSSDVLYEIFLENEMDYDLTYVCISSMLDEDAPITRTPQKSTSNQRSQQTDKTKTNQSAVESFETSRRNARNFASKRKEYFLKADQANRHGMTGVAAYYINQAREQTRLLKDANRTACEFLSQQRLVEFRRTNRLDLHELLVDEALQLFKQVENELNQGNKRTTSKRIEVITGYGKNSVYGGGNGKIRSTILNYLRQRNYKYTEPNKGAIYVQF